MRPVGWLPGLVAIALLVGCDGTASRTPRGRCQVEALLVRYGRARQELGRRLLSVPDRAQRRRSRRCGPIASVSAPSYARSIGRQQWFVQRDRECASVPDSQVIPVLVGLGVRVA
jgi:hypothetical protein